MRLLKILETKHLRLQGHRGPYGKPQPEYFQNASKYRALSAAHKSLDDQLEGLIEAGVLSLRLVSPFRYCGY